MVLVLVELQVVPAVLVVQHHTQVVE